MVFAHRHVRCLIKQDIRRLEHGIGEQRDRGAFAVLARLVLELGHPAQPAHPRGTVQQPLQFGMRGNLRLVEQDRTIRIDTTGDQRSGHFQRGRVQVGRYMRHGNGMQVGQKEQALAAFRHGVLHVHPIADRPEVIAKVEIASGLDAGNDTHGRYLHGLVMAGILQVGVPLAERGRQGGSAREVRGRAPSPCRGGKAGQL